LAFVSDFLILASRLNGPCGKLTGHHDRTPNDQRSDALNPTSQDYKDSMDNKSEQLNPESETYESSRGEE
jgi:hypothetical protein